MLLKSSIVALEEMKFYVVSGSFGRGVCYAEALSGAASLLLVIELIIYDHGGGAK